LANANHSSSTVSENSSTASTLTNTVSPSSSLNHAHHFLSLKLNTKNYLLWNTQLVPFLCGQKLLGFIDGSNPCPPLTILVNSHCDVQPNPTTIAWQDQDQLLFNLLVSFLKFAFASPSNSCILHLHMQMPRSQENDESVTTFLQHLKSHADELSTAGRPVSQADFNIYIFKGLKPEFKDLVTTLFARSEPVTYSELLGLLLSPEFLRNTTLDSLSLSQTTPSNKNTSPASNFSQRTPSSPNQSQPPSFHNHGHRRSPRGHGRGK
ncbi:UBN2 domain-containing protein/UBN2_3 domain-containing protein, partial [Cephalotus follicularis]